MNGAWGRGTAGGREGGGRNKNLRDPLGSRRMVMDQAAALPVVGTSAIVFRICEAMA